jgi:uncharacterized repeat protein (TIGR01451 family)
LLCRFTSGDQLTKNQSAMKKLLLLFVMVLSFSFASAQMGQPFDVSLCGPTEFYFADETGASLGNLNQNDYTVTYHLSQADADNDINALPEPFLVEIAQTIFVRVEENANPTNFQTSSFTVSIVPAPEAPDQNFTVCDNDGNNDGYAFIDLGSVAEQVAFSAGVDLSTVSILFYESETNAMAGISPIDWQTGYVNVSPFNQIIWVSMTNTATICTSYSMVLLNIVTCGTECLAPNQLSASNITNTSLVLGWTEAGTSTQWEVIALPAGAPAPTAGVSGIFTMANPFVFTDLQCGGTYEFYVRSVCGSTWSGPLTVDMPCIPLSGQPANLEMCSDTTQACFDLTQNDQNVLGTLDPLNYTVTYYTSEADAQSGNNPVADPSNYCITQPGMAGTEMYVRLQDNITSTYTTFVFGLTVRQVVASNFTPIPMTQCDQDLNGVVVFDLTTVAAQINTANPLSYYTNSLDATSETGANAMANPQAFEMSATMGTQSTTIFVRENISGDCDIVYSLQLFASANCNSASDCAAANPLCGSLGVPFSNTTNGPSAQPGIDYDCLFTQPNPTWFFLPISQAGNLDFFISQSNAFGTGLDVDYICWGPFDSTVSSCNSGSLNAMHLIGCSYSAAPTESFTISNAQPGEYYILMVTNFSNQPGLITITNTNAGAPGAGEIDCTGLGMTAFLDSNNNGTKDTGESNFTLGQFHYEMNSSGVVHNIISATGSTAVYDTNAANSYDLGYTVDASYAANYSVSPSSYNNVSVVPGGGLTHYYFPVTVTQAYDDLAVTIIPNGTPMPGFTYSNIVRYTNLGSQTVASGTVTFSKPSDVFIVSVSEAGAIINTTGFTYNFSNLQPFESRDIVVTMQVPVIPNVSIGQTLTASADIVPLAGDVAPENNNAVATQIIIGSYDPNDKSESRGEYVLFSSFGPEDFLYYTIRFENSGTAPALTVKINDVLESQLDETSVRMVAASHDYVLDRTGNVLNWTFENIQLPYASANPEGAKGYVQFKVKPKPGYAIGDIIENTASIFFDYNPAIVTNTFRTHFVTSLGNPVVGTSTFAMYPNPAGDHVTVSLNGASDTISGIAVYDMIGKKVLVRSAGSNVETFDVSTLGSGMYFVEVMTSAQVRTIQKLVIK